MVPLLIAAGLILAGMMAIIFFWGGTIVGDHEWPWESAQDDDDDGGWLDPIVDPIKKGFTGLLILGAVIVAATLYKGGK